MQSYGILEKISILFYITILLFYSNNVNYGYWFQKYLHYSPDSG